MDAPPRTIAEAARQVPVRAEVDVLVCGGGLGGISAAIAAARAGAKTLLVERNAILGGVATAGMCCSIFNCFYTSEHRLATTGNAVEIADALAQAEGYGRRWHDHKGHIIYDIERGKLVFSRRVVDAGVQILLHTVTAGAVLEGSMLRGVIVESKSGREAILARATVDATGDADVAAAAGAPVRVSERGVHSLCFRLGNVDVDAFVGHFRTHPNQYPAYMDVNWSADEALAQYDDCGTLLFPHGGGMQLEAFQQAKRDGALPNHVGIQDTVDACQMHAIRRTGIVHVVTGFTRFDGLDIAKISQSIHDGRQMAFTVADVYRRYVPGFSEAFVAGTATNLGVRTSRYIDGEFRFTADMMAAGTRQPDVVGRAVGWDHPTLHQGPRAWGCQVMREDSFDLPYRCTLPRQVDGLLMGAGRSLSTTHPSLLRVMVHTMVVGQAAGAAAAMAVKTGTTPQTIDVSAVQGELRRQGVCLNSPD
jgi:ribulose 1,5-bisphosphate synthetase/thiazole synthase